MALPTAEVIATWNTAETTMKASKLFEWAGVTAGDFNKAVMTAFGFDDGDFYYPLAYLTDQEITNTIDEIKLADAALRPVQKAKIRRAVEAARLAAGKDKKQETASPSTPMAATISKPGLTINLCGTIIQ